MRRLALITLGVLLMALASTLFVRPEWAFDAGVFHAFLGALVIIAILVVNSMVARRSSTGSMALLGPGLLTVVQTFWTTMAINIACASLIMQLDKARHGPDNYAIGLGAFVPYLIGLVAVMACLLFALVKWWPLRVLLATASGCTAAFACMAVAWWR